MSLLYGKCVGIARNTETDTGSKDNCKWKTNSNDLELAKFGNIKVSTDIFEKLYILSVPIGIYTYISFALLPARCFGRELLAHQGGCVALRVDGLLLNLNPQRQMSTTNN